jgi:hypothetical protein
MILQSSHSITTMLKSIIVLIVVLLVGPATAFVSHTPKRAFGRVANPIRVSTTQTITHRTYQEPHSWLSLPVLSSQPWVLPALASASAAAALVPLLAASSPFLPPDALMHAASLVSDPKIQAEVCTDISHVVMDLLAPTRVSLKLGAVIVGRFLALRADYLPDESIAPEEFLFQVGMVGATIWNQVKQHMLTTQAFSKKE